MGYAVLKSIHLLSIVVWVGGMFFVVYCLRAVLAKVDAPLRVTVMRDALSRFLRVVTVAAFLALITGTWMIATASRVSVRSGIGFNMPIDWHVMTTLGVLMIAIFGYVRFALFKQVESAADVQDWPAAGVALGKIRSLVIVNLVFAVIIIVITRLGEIA